MRLAAALGLLFVAWLGAPGVAEALVQLEVAGEGDYGVILPVPAEPVLDDNPIPTSELDELSRATAPWFTYASDGDSDSSGCGCFALGGGSAAGDEGQRDVQASEFVDIGPVTAVVLQADSASALNTWLTDNGFVVQSEHQATMSAYATPGSYFIAFKRSDAAPPGPSSVGIHFSMLGDRRGYALRMSRMGAAPELAITVFVVWHEGVGPEAPFEGLTLNQLEGIEPADFDASYRRAVADAVRTRDGLAFVVEGVFPLDDQFELLQSGHLRALVDPGRTLTRLTTVVAAESLVMDVEFTASAPVDVTNWRELGAAPTGLLWLGALLVTLARRRRTSRIYAT
jgi:hypothetical protein